MEESLYIKSEQFDPKNKKQVVSLQILSSLEISTTFRRWFKSESLQENEIVIGISMCYASLGEALHVFKKSVDLGIICKNENWDDSTKNSWDYLFSEEAEDIKRGSLKYIRDKIAFHIDPETIKDFMNVEKDKKHKLSLFQLYPEKQAHSPMITSILSYKLFERLLSKEKEGLVTKVVLEKIVDMQNELQNVISSLMMDEFEIIH